MKTLIVLIAVLMSATTFAKPDAQDVAERLFNKMSAAEALTSNKFDVQVMNINMPGTSTWFKPSTSLCLAGNTIQTIKPVEFCNEWTVELKEKEFGKDYKTFKYLGQAQDKADGKNGKGNPVCTSATYKIVSSPLVFSYEGCVLWGVDREHDTARFFKSFSQAKNYADDSSEAKGNAYCAQEGMITRKMPTTYEAKFYRNTSSGSYDSSKYVGSHVYPIRNCAGATLPPVVAN